MKSLPRDRQNQGVSQLNPATSSHSAPAGQGAKGERSRRWGGEDGFVMMVSLILLVLFTWLGINGLTASTMETRISDRLADNIKSFYTAEAGLERAKSILRTKTAADLNAILVGSNGQLDSSKPDTDPVNSDNGILPELGSSVSYAGSTYQVKITDNNDGDNNLGVDNDRRVIINSTGQDTQGNTRTLSAEVWGKNFSFKAAMSLFDNQMELELLSTALSVTGFDKIYSDTGPLPGSGPNVPGIATGDVNITTTSEINCYSEPPPNSACDKVTGVTGTPPDGTRDYFSTELGMTLTDLQNMRADLIAAPDISYSGSTTLSGGTLGTANDPKVTYVNDTLVLKGNVSGAGILIVDRDLRLEGNFTWQGVILIGICSSCDGRFRTVGGNNSKIYGAVAMANPTSSHSAQARIKMDGDAGIYYSKVAISLANRRSFRTLSWKEELY